MALGCAAAPAPDGFDEWCAQNVCHPEPMALSPGEGLGPVAEHVLERMTAATGIPFHVHPRGVPVRTVPELLNDEGKPTCGRANRFYEYLGGPMLGAEVLVADPLPQNCAGRDAVLLHEAIHIFAPRAEHVRSGLFAAYGTGALVLDESALRALCSGVECSEFAPERL